MASITWSITDASAMRQIKSTKGARLFRSQPFPAFGHQWFLGLYPNGCGGKSHGTAYLFLFAAALSPKVRSLQIRYKLGFRAHEKPQTAFQKKIEGLLDVAHEGQETLARHPHGKPYTSIWPKGTLKLSDIQQLDRLTFTVDFDLIGALDRDGNSILGQFKDIGAERINKSIHGIDVFAAAVTWRLTDASLLKQIKCARMGSCFFSPFFEAFGHKWYLKVQPNGNEEKNRGSTGIYLYTTALSPKIKAMSVCRKLTFAEGDVSQIRSRTLTPKRDYVNSWPQNTVTASDLTEHNELTFRVELDLYGAFDEYGKDILSHFKDDDEKQLNLSVANVHQPKASFTWRITDQSLLRKIKSAKVGQEFKFPTFTAFALEWYVKLYPNGLYAENEGNLALFLFVAELPPKIKSLLVRQTQRIIEIDVANDDAHVFDKSNRVMCSWPWGSVKLSDILDLDQLTFTVDFDVLEAQDHDGNDISANLFAIEQQSQPKAFKYKVIVAQKEKESMRNQLEMEQKAKAEVERDIPESFLCPLTHRVMREPVIAFDGRSYEREAIEEYLKKHNKSPVTGTKAITTMVFPNHDLSSRIIAFIEAQEMASQEDQQSKEGEGETTFE